MPKRHALNAAVCRDIVLTEVHKHGPISAHEMYQELRRVFPNTDYRVFCSALTTRDGGIAVINGVIDTVPNGLAPLARHESGKRKRTRDKFVKALLRK